MEIGIEASETMMIRVFPQEKKISREISPSDAAHKCTCGTETADRRK